MLPSPPGSEGRRERPRKTYREMDTPLTKRVEVSKKIGTKKLIVREKEMLETGEARVGREAIIKFKKKSLEAKKVFWKKLTCTCTMWMEKAVYYNYEQIYGEVP